MDKLCLRSLIYVIISRDFGPVVIGFPNSALHPSAIRFATNAPYRTHHSTLYSSVNLAYLYTPRKNHWLMLIYKTLLGLTPPYLRYLLIFQPWAATGTSCIEHSNWFYLNFFFQRLNHGHSCRQLWLLCMMYSCLFLLELCAVDFAQCLYHVFVLLPLLSCWYVVLGLFLCSGESLL